MATSVLFLPIKFMAQLIPLPHTSIDSDGGSELLTVHFCMLMFCIILYVGIPFGSQPIKH